MKYISLIITILSIIIACNNSQENTSVKNIIKEEKKIILDLTFHEYFDTSFIRYTQVYGSLNNWESKKIYTNKSEPIIDSFSLDCFQIYRDSFPIFELKIDTIYKDEINSFDEYLEIIEATGKSVHKNYIKTEIISDMQNHIILVSKRDSILSSIISIIWDTEYDQYGFEIRMDNYRSNDVDHHFLLKTSNDILKSIKQAKLKYKS